MPQLSISTWSLHRELGPMYPGNLEGDGHEPDLTYGEGNVSLLDVPALVAGMGIRNLEICHFHLPRTDAAYLAELRGRLDDAGVRLATLLIDTGDVTAPDPAERERNIDLIGRWIGIAGELGAARVRVIAGDAEADPEGEAVRRSIDGLARLEARARPLGVSVITENWRRLASRPEPLLQVLDGLDGSVGLCADFGNFKGPAKYDDLGRILPHAGTVHAKADFPSAGVMDEADFGRCLDLSRDARFGGEYVLIFDGPGEEIRSLERIAATVRPYL